MHRILLLVAVMFILPVAIQAQDDVSRFEVFGGYSYLRTGNGWDIDSHGWNTSVAVNLNDYFALKGDFAGYYNRYKTGNAEVNGQLYTFLFGPQVSIRNSTRATPFVHALFGVARDITAVKVGANGFEYGETGFAMAVGGGLDYRLNNNISWRLFQADYMLTQYRGPVTTPPTALYPRHNINHFRLSTGIVIQ